MQQAQRFLDDERVRLEAGAGSELDVLRADVAVENLRPQLVDAENSESITTLDLKRLVNVPIEQPLRLTTRARGAGRRCRSRPRVAHASCRNDRRCWPSSAW